MIEAIDLTVRRRGRTVLDAVSFDVRPGQVTGVLGGTGAGKTVLLRRMVELERGRGETLFDGRPYRALRRPMREVGLLLDPAIGDPDRTVRGHLRLALATDRGAAREGVLASARQSAGAGAVANRYGPGDGSRSVDSVHAVGARAGLGRASADASVRNASGRTASADRLGIDVEEDAEFAEALGVYSAHGRADESDADAIGIGARRSGRPHGGAEGGDGFRRRRWLRFGRRSLHDEGDLAAGIECAENGCEARHDESDFEQRNDAARRGRGGLDESDLADRIERTRRGRPADRIDAVLDIVGLTEQSRTRLSDLTEGMATRLGIAVALLGDPKTLLLDCPDRGLEPEGVAWLGALLRAFTAQGRAALVTGSDTETLIGMVDRVLLLDSGYLVGTRTAEEVLRAPTGASVVVRSPQIVRFAAILAEAGARSTQGEGACLEVRGLDRARVGDLAYRHSIPVHELSDRFTGSDPGDLVLAACTGRRARPVVPIQGFPDGKRVVSVPTPVSVGTTTAPLSGVRAWGAKGLRPARVDAAGTGAPVARTATPVARTGTPVSNVRVMNVGDVDALDEPSVRLITVVPEPAVGDGSPGPVGDGELVAGAGVDTASAGADANAGAGANASIRAAGAEDGAPVTRAGAGVGAGAPVPVDSVSAGAGEPAAVDGALAGAGVGSDAPTDTESPGEQASNSDVGEEAH
ncbi:ATP-binding cassette domain-containing protein [Actinocrinis sp.]|uniref:ATP-binding cassette domain-containing protein n=1 Tax=Actinocrinis sp. TaxID=1920516 RepID=UPI002D2B3608|nr:ATP-binding cassette domain-containing protein [Actinocrinis sp.]HZP54223.1 ATP-binding cassette domain-containing protein [Actinocrinis sp.]